jgi:CheY-like chemotaxis protein
VAPRIRSLALARREITADDGLTEGATAKSRDVVVALRPMSYRDNLSGDVGHQNSGAVDARRGIDGDEVGRRTRAALGSRGLLVALTAYGREQDRRRSRARQGFDTHLLKPAIDADLIRVLARAAGGES